MLYELFVNFCIFIGKNGFSIVLKVKGFHRGQTQRVFDLQKKKWMIVMTSKAKRKLVAVIVIVFILVASVVLIWVLTHRDSKDKKAEYVKKPLSEAVAEAANVIGNTYDNIILPETFSIDCSDKLYNLKCCEEYDGFDVIKMRNDVTKALVDPVVDISKFKEVDLGSPYIWQGYYDDVDISRFFKAFDDLVYAC